ncbi:MAG: radical SAM protein [Candidatus Altiarchaeota archaeon]
MERVLFVVPPSKGDYGRPGYPHIGISYLVASLREDGVESDAVDMRLGTGIGSVIARAKKFKPDIVGVTTYTLEYLRSYEVINALKEALDLPLVAGGPHVSVMGDDLMAKTGADYAVVAEGENTILSLCREEPPDGIENLIWRGKEGIVRNKKAQPIRDLDALPYPAYDVFDLDAYDNKQIPIVSSRGCPYQCVYCSIRLTMSCTWRPRSPENVVGEIRKWYDRGYRDFQFTDDNFTLDMERAGKICDMIIDERLDIKWDLRNGVRVDRVDKPLLKKMKDAGCFFVAFGIESGNQKVLDAMKKGITLEQVTKAVHAAKSVRLRASGFFIIGTPEETYETAMDSVKFAKGLPLDETRFYNAMPYPGTEFYEWVAKNGTFLEPMESYLNGRSHQRSAPVFETKEFPLDERVRALNVASKFSLKRNFRKRFGPLAPIAYGFWSSDALRGLGRRGLSAARKAKNTI